MFFSLAFTPPQFPRDAKPHNSCIRPGNPSPGGRVKSLCLRPLPPADPAPARPLGGICLGVGGGGFQPGNRPRSLPSHFCPGRGSRTCRGPLCCPPRPPESTAVSESSQGRVTDRAVRVPAVPASLPRTQRSTPPGGDSGEGRGEVTTDGAHEPHGSRDLPPCKEVVWLPWVARSGTGPTGAPWCPTRCS